MYKYINHVLISIGIMLLTPVICFANNTYEFESKLLNSKNPFTGVIINYELESSIDDTVDFEIRFEDKGSFTEWVKIETDIDGDHGHGNHSLVNTNLTQSYQYRINTKSGADLVQPKIENIKFTFINAKGEEGIIASIMNFASTAKDSVSGLKIISRSQWGAKDDYNYAEETEEEVEDEEKSIVEEDDPEIQKVISTENGETLKWPMAYIKNVRMIVVHHTASTNELDNAKQAIRNIQYYHAISRKWGDIGYNYIIDQEGNIYEGRKGGEKVVGGHSLPVNKTSIGISVLGNFETQKVPKAVVSAIVKLASAKATLYGLDVNDTVEYKDKMYPVFGGHKDNSKTACPGKNLYELIPTIRSLVETGTSLDDNESSLAAYNYAYTDQDSLRESTDVKTGENVKVEIQLKNAGKKSWSKNDTYLVALNKSEYSGYLNLGSSEKIATLKESSVAPGKVGTFTLNVIGGQKGGATTVIAQGILNGEKKNSVPIFIPFNVVTSSYNYQIIGASTIDLRMEKGEAKTIKINYKNTGDLTWNENYKFVKLGTFKPKDGVSQLFNSNRVADFGTAPIKKNETYIVTLNLKAPNKDVTIEESFAPLVDGLTWFEKETPLTIKVVVGDGTPIIKKTEPKVDLQSESNDKILGPKIRVNISNFNLTQAEISASEKSDLIIDEKVVTSLDENEKVKIIQNNESLTVEVDGTEFTGKTAKIESNDSDNILTIHNYENRPTWNTSLNDNQFRGNAELRIIDNKLSFINVLWLEHYMRGVAEISNNTNIEKIKTIMVAARTYAFYHVNEAPDRKFPGKGYNLDDSPERTQKYLGYGFEKRSSNVVKALTETAGKIITYNDKVVIVPYFNNSDGRTRSAEEVWGWKDAPYLVSVSDSYCAEPTQLLGHGVGISGCGSTGMAEEGFSHEDIIQYYLKGVEFKIAYKNTLEEVSEEDMFSDVDTKTQFKDAIAFVKSKKIIQGYPDGSYGPKKNINRAEFTKILLEAKFGSISESSNTCFKDLKKNEWYVKYVCFAKEEGIIQGYPDGSFKPAQEINIAEALKIVLETFYAEIPEVDGEWYSKYESLAKKDKIYIEDTWKKIGQNLTRSEMAEVIYRILK